MTTTVKLTVKSQSYNMNKNLIFFVSLQIFKFFLIELSGVCTELLKDDTSFHLVLHVLSQKIFCISCN